MESRSKKATLTRHSFANQKGVTTHMIPEPEEIQSSPLDLQAVLRSLRAPRQPLAVSSLLR